MKKIIWFILVGIILIPLLSFASIDSNLKYGAKGAQVTELQEFLIDAGFLQGQATGNFYSLTLKAVKAFQKANNIPNTGFVGALTRAEINSKIAIETSSSTTQQIIETGTTTSPIVAHPILSALQKQNTLIQEQNNTVQQIQQTVQQIQQNTKPIVPPVVIPDPIISDPVALAVVNMSLLGSYSSSVDNQNDALLWGSSVSVANEPVIIKNLKLRMIGSIPLNVLQNLNLYIDNTKFGETTLLDSNGNISFSGNTKLDIGGHEIKLKGDIIGGNGRSFSISLSGYGSNTITNVSGLSVLPTLNNVFTVNQFISTGSATVSVADDSNSGNIVVGATDVSLGKFRVIGHGEQVRILGAKLSFKTSNQTLDYLSNVKLYFDNQIVSRVRNLLSDQNNNSSANNVFGFSSTTYLKPGEEHIMEVRADLNGLIDGNTIQIIIVPQPTYLMGSYSATQSAFPAEIISGNVLTVVKE